MGEFGLKRVKSDPFLVVFGRPKGDYWHEAKKGPKHPFLTPSGVPPPLRGGPPPLKGGVVYRLREVFILESPLGFGHS